MLSLSDASVGDNIYKKADTSSYLCDAACKESLTEYRQGIEVKQPTSSATQVRSFKIQVYCFSLNLLFCTGQTRVQNL